MQKNYLIAIFTFLLFISGTYISLAQCTEAKDVEMAKYMKLTKNQDAQGCSHCGLLAMYFCSAKYCATPEDIKQVGAMIDACKKNILTMGKPYCCPDYLDKQPEWGSMVNSQTQGTSSNVSGSNPVMQNNNFLTTEDGINKLINNPAFIQDVLKLGTEELTLENIDKYMADYVPEYANFKIKNKIDINKIYYANSEDVASDVIADNLGSLFKMNGAQTETLKNAINGNLSYVPTSNLSTGLGNSLYERGKDKKVDYGVDYAVDFFQQKMGDGGVNSALIDMGGGLLGGLATDINKRYEEKMAKEAILYKALEEQNLFLMGETKVSLKGKKLGKEHTPDQQDLIIHNQANSKVPSLYAIGLNTPDYEQAIQLYSKAIDIYKQKPERAYFLYIAFAERAKAKMQIGAYKAAIIDYYFAEEVLEKILNGQLPDKSVKSVYPVGYFDSGNKKKYLKGKVEFTLGALSQDDKAVILIGRAFAKYRLMDYTGSIADCNLAFKAIVMTKNQTSRNNSYRDFTTAIVAMSKFGLGDYNEAYALFSGTNITDEIIDDIDNDGIIDFLDPDEKGLPMYTDTYEGLETFNFYGLPNYFAFDIIQVKGLTFYKTKHIDEAIALYDKLIASENESTKYIGAKKMFTRSGGDIASVYASLSSFYFEKKDNAKAMDYINDALNYDPGRKEYVQKKALYSKTPDLEKASKKATVKKTKKPVADKKAAAKQNSLKATAATTEKTTEKKKADYYTTKYTLLSSGGKNQETFNLLKEAIRDYPENEAFFTAMIKCLEIDKSAANALEASGLYPNDKKRTHLLKSLYGTYKGDAQMDETEMFAAFENGLYFYNLWIMYQMDIRHKPYYCRLFLKHATPENNNFISPETDKEQVRKEIDSSFTATMEQYKNVKGMEKQMKKSQKMLEAKMLGNIKEYSDILDDTSMHTSMTAMDRIECLFILGKKEEALKFAKKIKSKLIVMDTPITNNCAAAIDNIIAGSCN